MENSETDLYKQTWHKALDIWTEQGGYFTAEFCDDESAIAYLREHFVPRNDLVVSDLTASLLQSKINSLTAERDQLLEKLEARDAAVGGWMAEATALRIDRDKYRSELERRSQDAQAVMNPQSGGISTFTTHMLYNKHD